MGKKFTKMMKDGKNFCRTQTQFPEWNIEQDAENYN
jgi:hypothetical protein